VRWLIVHPGPEFSVADVFAGWAEALTGIGEQVKTYGLNTRMVFYSNALVKTGRTAESGLPELRRACDQDQAIQLAADGILAEAYRWWPDVVLVVSAFFIPAKLLEILRSRGHKIVILHTESCYEDTDQIARAHLADINLINDPTNLESFRAVCPASWYMPHAYRPGFHSPGPVVPAMACDLAFSGTGYGSRIAFFEAMNLGGLDVILAGNWAQLGEGSPLLPMVAHELDRCLDNEQTVQLYRSARAGINIYRREAQDAQVGLGWSVGPREIEMAAIGCFYLRDKRPEGDELLWMLPGFDGPGDASEKLRWWLAPDQEESRMAAALAARRAVAARTFGNHARELLRLLGKLPVRV
jgi:spore maturation protein CgeB